jgi:aspartate/methionine/tyrosine aminotransferase
LAQHAALACFERDAMDIYAMRKEAFRQRRDYLVPALEDLGFHIPVKPDGAFYIYADIQKFGIDSVSMAYKLLREAGVSTLPGVEFGPAAHAQHAMRLSYCTSLDELQEAIHRMSKIL